jgi:cellulase
MVYASKAGSSLSWTKIAEDGFDGKSWAVDKLLAGSYTGKKGQHKMKLPALSPGEYILRPEILALHEGNRQGGAQFYMECIHVTVGGSGTVALPAGVSFPGAYKATDPGVLFNIYGGASSYLGVGPKLWSGAATAEVATSAAPAPVATSAAPVASSAAPASTLATVTKPAPTPAAGSDTVTAQKYAQCGGQGFSGATACASGSTCTKQNDYYSQCI